MTCSAMRGFPLVGGNFVEEARGAMPVAQTRNTHLRNSNRSVDSCMRPRSFDQYHQDRQALAASLERR
jgi:hypothetical protein